ncbi:MAG: alpha-galactosidase [Verrucomicrobiae bacterium]|nr:alpha-galactosidase [Verrucomicrobiae bacterium]
MKKRFHFYGKNSVLREEAVWGSWNLNVRPGGHGDIDHDYIMANARAIGKLHRKVRWMMLDDGYQRGYIERKKSGNAFWGINRGIDLFNPSLASPHDPRRFPRGMRHVAAAIRQSGLKPAIWCTPLIHPASPLARRHPDWLLQPPKGKLFMPEHAFLDYSIPEVRAYFLKAWETIFQDWGYEGLKLDFWTFLFELPGLNYRGKDKTAIELRNQFLSDIRGFISSDGYLLTCCVTNAGNPFPGRFADASRNGPDIGSGFWNDALSAARWGGAASMFYDDECLLPDADSFGWAPSLTEDENRAWAAFVLAASGMCEIGGDMTRLKPEARRMLRQALDFFRPCKRRTNPLFGFENREMPASHWVLERAEGCNEVRINWLNYAAEINIAVPGRDRWSGETIHRGRRLLPKHRAIIL